MDIFLALIDSLIKLSPIVGLLLIAIYYLYTENKALKSDVKELNLFIRDESTKNIKILDSVSNTLSKLVDATDDNIAKLKEWIALKFDNLK